MALFWILLEILLLVTSALSIAIAPPPVKSVSPAGPKTLLPLEDAFYLPPEGFKNASLGKILRYRSVTKKITLNNKDAIKLKAAWQILYRTQNSVKEPTVSITTVLVPYGAKPNHLLSYAMFSDSAFSGCNPSVTLQVGTREDNQWNQVQIPILVQALTLGYYVSVSDYGGVQAAFSAGPQAGYATLDSIRAVLSSKKITGIDANPITTLHGYSSGAQAIGWATEMHPTYAPELKIAGAAFGGLVPNLSALVELPSYRSGERAFLGPPVVLGLSHDYDKMKKWLDDNLIPGEKAIAFRRGENQCVSANGNFSNVDLGRYLKKGYDSIFEEIPRSVLREAGIMGQTSTPSIPWYLYHSAGDDVSPQELTTRIYDKHCKNGANILYEKNPMQLNHRFECAFGIGGAYRWMMDRHEGKPIQPGCSVTDLTEESKRAVKENLLIKGILSSVWAYLGFKIGPNTRSRQLEQLYGTEIIYPSEQNSIQGLPPI